MNTHDPNILRAIRSKDLFQIEFIDRIDQNPDTRDQFIAFILNDSKAKGGVRFALTTFKVNYRYTLVVDANGVVCPPPSYNLISVHFNIQVTEFDSHLKTFLSKIRKGSEVVFTVTINQSDENINSFGLEKHLLTGMIGSDSYLIATWIGKPNRAPVRYPKTSLPSRQPNNPSGNSDVYKNCAVANFADYSTN